MPKFAFLGGVIFTLLAFEFWDKDVGASDWRSNWYFSGNAGASIFMDADVTDTFLFNGAQVVAEGEAFGDIGPFISGAIGTKIGNLRLEAELSYQSTEIDSLTVNQGTALGITVNVNIATDIDAHLSATSLMVNGWYELAQTASPWKPYFGVGLGISEVNLDVDTIAGLTSNYDESDSVFAYQLGLGVDYLITNNVSLGLSYRFYGNEGAEFDDGVDDVDLDYMSHNLLAGLRINF